jgi:phosphate/phosphite/phosphonate ABC transporter binding protein
VSSGGADWSAWEGRRISHYLLELCLSSGEATAVFEALDERLERRVALKVMTAQPEEQSKLRAEADLLKHLEHPNVMRLYDFGFESVCAEAAGQDAPTSVEEQVESTPGASAASQASAQTVFWIAAELLRGESLRAVLEREQRLPLPRALSLFVQLLEALAYVHERGVAHCDVKPENLMLSRQGVSVERLTLVDFGIGRSGAESEVERLGTPRYLAPEQVIEGRADARSDVYSAGAILFELASGRSMRPADELETALVMAASGEIEWPDAWPEERLEPLLRRALAFDAWERFEDGGAFHAALLPLLEARQQVVVQRASRTTRLLLTGAMLMLLVVASASLWLWSQERALERETTAAPPSPQASAVLAALRQGSVLGTAGASYEPDPLLVIGYPPMLDGALMRRELEPIRRYLSAGLERTVRWQILQDYQSLASALSSGRIAVGVLPPTAYLLSEQEAAPGTFRPLAFEVFDGAASSDGYLLCDEHDGYRELSALEGKRFCFTDVESTTGYLMPRHYIREQGFEPERFVGSVHWSGSHLQALRDLLDGKCDAAATYSGAYFSAVAHGIPSGRLRILAITGRSPQNVVVAGPSADETLAARLSELLLGFDPMAVIGASRVGDSLRISGYAPPATAPLDELRQILSER